MADTPVSREYTAQDIQILEGLEPVRKRPGMYLGNTGPGGLHHMIWEVVDNSVDEASGGFCNAIKVTMHRDGGVSVADNGRGIPVEIHPQNGLSTLQTVLTVLHAGGKFDKAAYKNGFTGGLHGVGVSVVNAVSISLVATVHRDGYVWQQSYSKGRPLGPVMQVSPSSARGTEIYFRPDPEIFTDGCPSTRRS